MEHHDYLLLPRLEVRHANAQACYWALSPAIVVAVRQMAHALSRALDLVEDEAGVALIHHHVEMLGEQLPGDWTFRPHQRRGAVLINAADYNDKNKHVVSTQPVATMHLRVSLVVRYQAGAPIDLEEVGGFLRGARLAGGSVVEHGRPELLHEVSDVWARLRSGFVVTERPDLLRPGPEDRDLIDPFLRALDRDDPHRESWVLPATLGYAALTPIEPRVGAREGYPAAYAEPLVGLVQYRPVREARDTIPLPFWDYARPEAGVFLVTHEQPI